MVHFLKDGNAESMYELAHHELELEMPLGHTTISICSVSVSSPFSVFLAQPQAKGQPSQGIEGQAICRGLHWLLAWLISLKAKARPTRPGLLV